jgi:beta propeller repeat protein
MAINFQVLFSIGLSENDNLPEYEIIINTTSIIGSENSNPGIGNVYINNNTVIWLELNQNGYLTIFKYDLVNDQTFQLTNKDYSYFSPSLYGDFVVFENWTKYREKPYDNISLHAINHITNYSFFIHPDGRRPSIYKNFVVYVNNTNHSEQKGDIYLINLESNEDISICINESIQDQPDIWDDYIVWEDKRYGNFDILLYDLNTQKEYVIGSSEFDERAPQIWDENVIWFTLINNTFETIIYNITTQEKTRLHDYIPISIWDDFILSTTKLRGSAIYSISQNKTYYLNSKEVGMDIFENNIICLKNSREIYLKEFSLKPKLNNSNNSNGINNNKNNGNNDGDLLWEKYGFSISAILILLVIIIISLIYYRRISKTK